MTNRHAALCIIAGILLAGCGPDMRRMFTRPKIEDGETVLMFPEWETSDSAFERVQHTNYFAVYNNGRWFIKERQADGRLTFFLKQPEGYKTVEKAKELFGRNITWATYRALYDALDSINRST